MVSDSAGQRRIREALDADPSVPLPQRLCSAAAEVTGLAGVGIAVMNDGRHLGTVCATGSARRAEQAQFDLGEGPCVDAHCQRHPVLVPDLSRVDRWVAFREIAEEAGIAAAFSFPLELGQIRLGVLSFYRDRPGDLGAQQEEDSSLLARFGVELLLGLPDGADAHSFPTLLSALDIAEWEVHQATGMVGAQAGVGMEDAFALLRGHAYATGRHLRDVAIDVVARRIRLDGQ